MKTRFQEDRLVMIHFFKIRRVYDHFKAKFNDLYNPGENIAIDEYIAWRGNLSFRVYMLDKPEIKEKFMILS